MIQKVIVLLIVAAAVFFAVRRLARTVKKKDCGCGCSGCPYKGTCKKENPPVGGNPETQR